MEAQKGFKSVARVGVVVLIAVLALLLSPSSSSPTIAQEEAYPLIPLVMWADGYHAVDDIAYGVAVDFQGNAIVVGTSGVIKYAPDGRKLWWTEYPGVAYGVATDSLADIVVAGTAGLVKFGSDGRRLWAVDGRFYKVAVAAGDRVVAVGPEGVMVFSPEGEKLEGLAYEGEPRGVASSDGNIVVIGTGKIVKYDLSGRRLWEVPSWGEPRDVAIDSDGNVIVVGSKGITKYSPTGTVEWRELFLGEPQAVATFPAEWQARFQGELFPPGDTIIVTGGYKNGDWDYRTVKYDSEGKEIWESRYDGRYGDDIPYDIAVSMEGHIYITGTSTLAKEGAGAGGESPPVVDQDYYTIQYAERPLPEALESRGIEPEELEEACPPETLPIAEFEVSNPNPLTGETVSFTNLSNDPDGYLIAWSWEFGDGATSQEWEPEHRYEQGGSYTV
ncbi:TPA: PKD domain-containing protein, partial [Candidatus Bipolaricaulota bacterium]|nr:PKD domain-containing protein [Candidatus Bipolaricaulota bacterium]